MVARALSFGWVMSSRLVVRPNVVVEVDAVERTGPLGRSPGWGLVAHCSAGPAIRAVIGPSSR